MISVQGSDWWKFSIWGDGELTNQHPAQEMAWEMAQEMPWQMPQEMPQEILGDRVEGRNLFNKAVIGGNLAF